MKPSLSLKAYKTLILSEHKLDVVDRSVEDSDSPQLVMKSRLAGICRSDVKEFLGTRTIRHDFGHEIVAEVVSCNVEDARLPNIGSLVVLDPHVKINRTSGFGELVVASGSVENLAKAFIEIPTTAINERFVFTEPLACAHHCVANLLKYRQAKNLNGLSVSIVGAGMTGTLIGLLCRYYGATITIVNRSAERLGFLAGTSVFSKDELSLINEVNREFDVVIPTTTFLFPEILEFCEKAVKESGAILLYGGTKAGDVFPSTDNVDIDKIRRTQQTEEVSIGKKNFHLCGTHGATTEDFKTVVKLLKDHSSVLPVERLISRRIKLDEVPRVLVEMTTNEIPGKIIVDF